MSKAVLRGRMLAPLDRAIQSWYDSRNSVPIFVALFLVAWTAFQIVTYAGIGLHPDLTEVYAWSRHLAVGYYKHPPLGALMAAGWFSVFPVTDWAFHLLAMANAALALYATGLIARRYLSGDKVLFALLLLLLLPFYQFHGQRFGANQVLLATWPLTTYFFLRAFESRAIAWSLAAGTMAALAMLGKYYSIFLIAALALAALMHPARLRYLKSPAPWVTIAIGLAIVSPHARWLLTTGFQSFDYAYTAHQSPSFADLVLRSLSYLAGAAGYCALPVAVYLLAVRPNRATLTQALWPDDPDRRMRAVALYGFLVLPALTAPFLGLQLNSLWAMPACFLLPVVLLAPPTAVVTRRAAVTLAFAVALFTLAMLAVAPVLAKNNFAKDGDGRAYTPQLGAAVTRAWHSVIGRPLTIVLGDTALAEAVSFYSADHPGAVPSYRFEWAPWVTPARLSSEGWAAVCREADSGCIDLAERLSAQEPRARVTTVTVFPRFLGATREPERFVIRIVPPRSFATRSQLAVRAQ